jgi:hypothetical protein
VDIDPEGRDLVIRTILGEAAGEPDFGQLAVAHVVRNRVNDGGYGTSAKDVVLAPKQFTPWETRRRELLSYSQEDPKYQRVGKMVDAVWGGQVPDFTKGATHFANVGASDPSNQAGWIADMQRKGAMQIGRHTFGAPDSAPGRTRSVAQAVGGLPPGFELDAPGAQSGGLPPGFELDDAHAKPAEVDAKGRIAQAHDSAIMAGGARATRQDLADRMNLIADEYKLTGEAKTGPTAKGAAARGLVRGPFLGFGDEVAGGVNAAGAFLSNLGSGQGASGEAAGRAYTNTVEADRILREQDAANHPVARTVGDLGGSLVAPIGPLGRVATAGMTGAKGALARGAEIAGKGGVVGAISGAGNADGGLEDRLYGAGGGAAIGFGVGAASRPVAGLAGYVGKPAVNTLRGILAPNSEVDRRIATVAAKGGGLKGQELEDAITAGKPVIVGDIGGAPLNTLARAAKNQSPEAAAELEAATADRFITQGSRLSDEISKLSGMRGGATETRDAIASAGKSATSPAYKAAYKAGDRGIWNPELERLASSPAVVAAMKAAVPRGKDRAVMEGYGGFNPGVTVTDTGTVQFAKGPTGAPTYPNLQYWDYVKRELSDGASAAYDAGRKSEGDVLGGLAKQMRTALDKEVPVYGKARATYAKFADADNAFEAGQNFVAQSHKGDPIGAMKRDLSQFSLGELELFKHGFATGLKSKIDNIPDNADVTNRIFNTKEARDRVVVALGKGGAAKLEAEIRVEKIMDGLRKAVSGNSTTAQQLLAAGIGEGAGQYFGWNSGLGGAAGIITRAGQRKLDQRIMRRVGETLASGDPETIRRLAKMAANSPQYMSALRSYHTRIAGLTGGENAQVGARAFGGPSSAAADEQQP